MVNQSTGGAGRREKGVSGVRALIINVLSGNIALVVKNMPGGRPKKKKRKNNLALYHERRSRERQDVTAMSLEIPTAAAVAPNNEIATTSDQSPV